MNNTLKTKLLQHLAAKKQSKGFTLVELLVVVIIVGILAAIALPNLMNQTNKAKQTEAKQNVAAVNRAQSAYRTENSTFASEFDYLALGNLTGTTTDSTEFYAYTLVPGTDSTEIQADAQDSALKSYVGGTGRYTNDRNQSVTESVVCESNATGTTGAGVNDITPTTVTAGGESVACPTGTQAL